MEQEKNNTPPLENRGSRQDSGFIVFRTRDLYGSKSEKSRSLLKTLRVLCISHSEGGLPPEDRPEPINHSAFEKYRDPLESVPAVREIVRKTYESLTNDGCMPFIAVLEIQRVIKVGHKPFLTREAICRLADIPESIVSVKNLAKNLEKKEYSFENISNSIVKLGDISKELQKELESAIPYIKGFIKYRDSLNKEGYLAVYKDDIKQTFGPDDAIFRNIQRSEIDKRVIDKYFDKINRLPLGADDVFTMEIDPLSMIQLLKRLMILHYENPRAKRKIWYSKGRKRIIKIM